MALPPNAVQHFAQKHIEAAEKHLAAVEDNLLSYTNGFDGDLNERFTWDSTK